MANNDGTHFNDEQVEAKCNIVSHDTEILVKTVKMVDGKPVKQRTGAHIPLGCTVSTHRFDLDSYLNAIYYGGPCQYVLPSNAELGSKVPIGPKSSVPLHGVDRGSNTMVYVPGQPAFMTFDHDVSEHASYKVPGPKDTFAILCKIASDAFKGAAYAGYYSSGSHIFGPDGSVLWGPRGHHTVFVVSDASEISRIKDILFIRACLAGYGYIFITRDGRMLVRTFFDPKVLEPQQPIFAGGSYCHDGIKQRRPAPIIRPGNVINTTEIAPLSEEEKKRHFELEATQKTAKQAEANQVRLAYQRQEIKRLTDRGMTAERARQTVESRMGGTLTGEDRLFFAEHGATTVADVLSEPDIYDSCYLEDPVAPDNREKYKAIFFANRDNGRPMVFCHSHGGINYKLTYDEQSLIDRINNANPIEIDSLWKRLIADANLDEYGLEKVLKAVKSKTGIGIQALRSAAKKILSDQNVQHGEFEDPALVIAKSVLADSYDNGRNLIHTEDGSFWLYNGTYWSYISENVLTSGVLRVADKKWSEIQKMYARQRKPTAIVSSFVNSVFSNLSNLVVKPGDPMRLRSLRPSVINMGNGELWLYDDGAVLKPHCPESYLTSCSTIVYDPDAKAPMFEKALRGMLCYSGGKPFPDQDDMFRHVIELLGYIIQAKRFLKVFIIVVGPGDNGKSRLTKLLELILGPDAICFERLSGIDNGNQFATSHLIGKLVLLDDDADHHYLLPDGFLKKIAEEKPFTTERKFKHEQTFTCQVVPIILTNSWPKSRDLTRGMRTRAQVLYLPRSFLRPSEVDDDHPDIQRPELWDNIYQNELPGVVNLLIEGFYRVKQRMDFLPPKSADKAFNMWLGETNVVSRFVNETCDSAIGLRSGITITKLYERFLAWASDNGVHANHCPQLNTFKSSLVDLGYRIAHKKIGSEVFGLRPKGAEKDINPDKVA